ncbi:hypothetical protein [Longimycelium tulufanense]|uniref:hypothetical protein n=1 Tax=Longimycelium tulufanense TaxID=907463 RepID=UPI001E4761F7|nr:hypothetical protein [Longimycelium tulufanense]
MDSVGVQLDPWQAFLVQEALAESDDYYDHPLFGLRMPKYAAAEVGIMVSRQNGKGTVLEALELLGLFLLGEKFIVHTAHEFKTAEEAFERLCGRIDSNPELKKKVLRAPKGNGKEGVILRNGQKIRFATRTKSGLRGFAEVDRLIFDEAMVLSPIQVRASMPTMRAAPNPQLVYTGSAGDKDSVQFGRVRSRALKGGEPRLMYAEWSIDPCTDFCPPDCADHDPVYDVESYAKANPGLGYRVTVEHIELVERPSMDEESFKRELLGVGDWPVEGEAWRVISEEHWQSCLNEVSAPQFPVVFAADVTPSRSHSCIVVAGLNGDQAHTDDCRPGACDCPPVVHVEITGPPVDHKRGDNWVIPRLVELCQQHQAHGVAIDKATPAGSFVDELEAKKIKILTPTLRDYAQACGSFYAATRRPVPTLAHLGQATLTSAVSGADKRHVGGLWAWDRVNTNVDISPLVAATLAYWGAMKAVTNPPTEVDFAWGAPMGR